MLETFSPLFIQWICCTVTKRAALRIAMKWLIVCSGCFSGVLLSNFLKKSIFSGLLHWPPLQALQELLAGAVGHISLSEKRQCAPGSSCK